MFEAEIKRKKNAGEVGQQQSCEGEFSPIEHFSGWFGLLKLVDKLEDRAEFLDGKRFNAKDARGARGGGARFHFHFYFHFN